MYEPNNRGGKPWGALGRFAAAATIPARSPTRQCSATPSSCRAATASSGAGGTLPAAASTQPHAIGQFPIATQPRRLERSPARRTSTSFDNARQFVRARLSGGEPRQGDRRRSRAASTCDDVPPAVPLPRHRGWDYIDATAPRSAWSNVAARVLRQQRHLRVRLYRQGSDGERPWLRRGARLDRVPAL